MEGNFKLVLSFVFVLAVLLTSTVQVSDAQTCPAPNPDSRFLTGPEFLTNRYTDASQIRAKLQQLGSWLQGDDVGDGKIRDVDPVGPPRIDFAQVVFDAARNPTNAPPGQERPINPDLLLATVQNENGLLIRKTRPKDNILTHIVNCGKPSTIRGQIQCAAEALRAGLNGYDVLVATGAVTPCNLVTPWGVDRISKTRDGGVSVKPRNAATGAIFVYTNEAGIRWGGNDPDAGGTAEFCRTWYSQRYRELNMFGNPPVDLTTAPTNPTLTCSAPEAQRNVVFSVAGGTPPYTWAVTTNITPTNATISACGANGEDAVLKPPVNNPNVGGRAYWLVAHSGVNPSFQTTAVVGLRCDGVTQDTCFASTQNCVNAGCNTGIGGTCGPTICSNDPNDPVPSCGGDLMTYMMGHQSSAAAINDRSQTMIQNGCRPCLLEMQGATVTVQDAAGAPVSTPVTVQ